MYAATMPAVSAISSQATFSSHTSLRLRKEREDGDVRKVSHRSDLVTSHTNAALGLEERVR